MIPCIKRAACAALFRLILTAASGSSFLLHQFVCRAVAIRLLVEFPHSIAGEGGTLSAVFYALLPAALHGEADVVSRPFRLSAAGAFLFQIVRARRTVDAAICDQIHINKCTPVCRHHSCSRASLQPSKAGSHSRGIRPRCRWNLRNWISRWRHGSRRNCLRTPASS